MKKIFKKNQIIITALAIMIIVAGYLNYTTRNTNDDIEVGEGEVLDYDSHNETANDNIDDSDIVDLIEEGTDIDDLSKEDLSTDELEEIKDISDEDRVQEVSDTGEIVKKDEVETETTSGEVDDSDNDSDSKQTKPGEAVLVSTTTMPDYFINAKLSREQLRAKNKETLMEVIDNANVSGEDKSLATQEVIRLTAISEKENATESLLEAKGYSDAVINMSEESVEVIVNAESLSDKDIAQIEDIVKRKTGEDISKIVISPVVLND